MRRRAAARRHYAKWILSSANNMLNITCNIQSARPVSVCSRVNCDVSCLRNTILPHTQHIIRSVQYTPHHYTHLYICAAVYTNSRREKTIDVKMLSWQKKKQFQIGCGCFEKKNNEYFEIVLEYCHSSLFIHLPTYMCKHIKFAYNNFGKKKIKFLKIPRQRQKKNEISNIYSDELFCRHNLSSTRSATNFFLSLIMFLFSVLCSTKYVLNIICSL